MLKILFPTVVLLLFVSNSAFSFPNEPDGFNESSGAASWGKKSQRSRFPIGRDPKP
jgi:hypothetical protein